MRILIVDDSKAASLALRRLLEEQGHEVAAVADGEEAWNYLRLQPDPERLVISDWVMPRLDGPDLCRRIRAAGETPYTYFILLTYKDLRKDRLLGLEAGADDFLVKPIDGYELSVALGRAGRILHAHASGKC
jgi:sigma-B regulation protein RsbU (phosphoserine phosphatase)